MALYHSLNHTHTERDFEAKYTLFLLRHVHVLSNDDDCSLGIIFQSFVNASS